MFNLFHRISLPLRHLAVALTLASPALADCPVLTLTGPADIEQLTGHVSAFADPDSYFHRYAQLDEEAAIARAREIWGSINGPNLEQNILPTRARASAVLRKDSDHTVSSVLLRKI